MGNGQFSASGDFQLRRIVPVAILRFFPTLPCVKEAQSGEKGRGGKKREKKERKRKGREGKRGEKNSIRGIRGLTEWGGEGDACVRPRMGQLFDAPLNKGSIHFVTHVTHNGRDRGNLYGSKNNPRRFLTRKKKRLRFNSRGILIGVVAVKLLINFK